MKRVFKVEKLPLDTLISLLIELYESGIDYIDMHSDNTDPAQDKLIIQTKDSYMNPNWDKSTRHDFNSDDDDEDDITPKKQPPTIETQRLSDDDINELL